MRARKEAMRSLVGRQSVWATGALLLVACANHAQQSKAAPAAPVPSSVAPHLSAEEASRPLPPAVSIPDLEKLFGISGSSKPSVEASSNGAPSADAYRQWVRRILTEFEPYRVLTPVILGVFPELPSDRVIGFLPLLKGESKAKGTFYYRQKPCPERELLKVRPWWDASTEVWVCRDDYRPEVMADGDYSCDVMFPQAETSKCGCGPNLMFCGTKEHKKSLKEATLDELRLTIKYLTESGRPFSDLVTMNETFRSGLADLFPMRTEFFVTGRFTPPDVKRPPALRPRPYPLQGGLLSTPVFLFGDSQRSMVASIWETFFCVPLRSQAVATQNILEKLHSETAFRETSLLKLASAEGCQNCHARLEYGQAFLAGWQSWLRGLHYIPQVASATPTARLYLRDHHDLRGEEDANLGSLGKMIARQPEFGRCMVSKAVNFVYEGTPVPYEVERHLARRFEQGQSMKDLLEDAVIARAFGSKALSEGEGKAADPAVKGER